MTFDKLGSCREMGIEACTGSDTELFYTGSLRNGQEPLEGNPHRIVAARFCDACSARVGCLDGALAQEGTVPMRHRFGLRAGLTPAQRYSVYKRDHATCPDCGATWDPIQHRTGILICNGCGTFIRVQAIPDAGDEWQDRHTLLAARLVEFLLEESARFSFHLPSVPQLAKKFSVRKGDVGRVFAALEYDGTIERDGLHHNLMATTLELRHWKPPHLWSVSQWSAMVSAAEESTED